MGCNQYRANGFAKNRGTAKEHADLPQPVNREMEQIRGLMEGLVVVEPFHRDASELSL
jgi:hypothetical protein